MEYDKYGVNLVVQIRRCTTCHCTEDIVNYSFYINGKTMRRYYICRSHNKARNARYRIKTKMKELNAI